MFSSVKNTSKKLIIVHLTYQSIICEQQTPWLVISVYLLSLPVAYLSNAPRTRLFVMGDSARIQDETTENSAWFFNVLGVEHRHTGPWFNVSSKRQLVIFSWPNCIDPKHCVHESYALPTELISWFSKPLAGYFA